ncbi:MAG: DUF4956 domain-containing protein [Lachnospiraceae bacterium]|nr:DUF4956 domain-containing protein [Lachnospiraceae bacterium]
MSFKDILKTSFLEGYTDTTIGTKAIILTFLIVCALALYIFFVYRIATRKTFYSKSFNIALAGVAVITAAIVLTMQSSIIVSLGMVGALSIVRFRTAIKDAMDLMFLFWSISVGIICGAGFAEIALILSVVVTVGILVLQLLPVAKAPMVLIVNADSIDVEKAIVEEIKKGTKHLKVKSRNMTKDALDLVIELRTKEGAELIGRIMEIKGVTSASLLSHDGEVTF